MLRRVMRDFRMGIKKENLVNIFGRNGWFSYLYILCVVPVLFRVYERVSFAVSYYAIVIPVVLVLILSRILPLEMPKIIYLCPLGEGERRKYIITIYWFKIILSILLEAAGVIALYCNGHRLGLAGSICACIAILCISINVNMYNSRISAQRQSLSAVTEELPDALKGYTGWFAGQMVAVIAYLCLLLIFTREDGLIEVNNIGANVILYIICPLIIIGLTVMVMTYFKPIVAISASYEEAYRKR